MFYLLFSVEDNLRHRHMLSSIEDNLIKPKFMRWNKMKSALWQMSFSSVLRDIEVEAWDTDIPICSCFAYLIKIYSVWALSATDGRPSETATRWRHSLLTRPSHWSRGGSSALSLASVFTGGLCMSGYTGKSYNLLKIIANIVIQI